MTPLVFFGIVFLLCALILCVGACMRSSQISREEEERHGARVSQHKEIEMDTGEGKFVYADDETEKPILEQMYPLHGGWFRVDEEVEIRGSLFRIKAVKPTELRLKLLKRKK